MSCHELTENVKLHFVLLTRLKTLVGGEVGVTQEGS